MLLPLPNDLLLEPVKLSLQPDNLKELSHIAFFVDGKPLPSLPEDEYAAFWDARRESTHNAQIWAEFTLNGTAYRTEKYILPIPVRFETTEGLETFEVTDKASSLPIRLKFAEGIQPKSIDIIINDTPVAHRSMPPFEQIDVPLSEWESSFYRVNVRLTDLTGATYSKGIPKFKLINKHQDMIVAQEREHQRKEIEARREAAVNHIRELLVGDNLKPSRPEGSIGIVNGLTVVQSPSSAFGVLRSIQAKIRKGTGKITLLADAKTDFKLSANTAIEYSKFKVEQMGYQVDWSQTDFVIALGTTNSISGDSAGVAMALATLSAMLNKPVDSSVAITGAINLDGSIRPVGGIYEKVLGAMVNASTTTIILPASLANIEELGLLFMRNPDLFTNKRIIAARNMEDVLKQALIGYDNSRDEAEQWILRGMRLFLQKKDGEALQAFQRAQSLTPENLTIALWQEIVRHGTPVKIKP